MVKIVRKKVLNPSVTLLEVEAPLIAKKARAGQFIILRLDEQGERIPLTIADYDREKGTVTIIFQKVGLTTELLADLNEGDSIKDFVGPLGLPTELPEGARRVCVVGGGGLRHRLPPGQDLPRRGAGGGRDRRLPLQGHRDPGGRVQVRQRPLLHHD